MGQRRPVTSPRASGSYGAGVKGINWHLGTTLHAVYSASGAVISGKSPGFGVGQTRERAWLCPGHVV